MECVFGPKWAKVAEIRKVTVPGARSVESCGTPIRRYGPRRPAGPLGREQVPTGDEGLALSVPQNGSVLTASRAPTGRGSQVAGHVKTIQIQAARSSYRTGSWVPKG